MKSLDSGVWGLKATGTVDVQLSMLVNIICATVSFVW